MERYVTPGWLTRKLVNPLVMRLGAATTLGIRTRSTGKLQLVPVNVLESQEQLYLVAVRGETQWVRNLRAAGHCDLRRRGAVHRYRADEVPVDQRGPIINAYREKWDFQVRHFFERLPESADHPVFQLVPA